MATMTRRTFCAGAGMLSAAALFGGVRKATAAGGKSPALPIPSELRPDAQGRIALASQKGNMHFHPGIATPTYGFNGPFLGPAIRVRRGQTLDIVVDNRLCEAITLHWHGLIIPGDVDGGPYQLIESGSSRKVRLAIDQPAATLWYHPHVYPITAKLVIMGLAGLFIVDDDEMDKLGLPSRWGVDDIPIVLQDRRFNDDGSFFYRFNEMAVAMGYVGDTMLVNGALQPTARTASGWLRLRILNGSNARNYRLAVSDKRPFYVIGSDGGLLEAPVEVKELPIAAGERFEVMVDARDGKAFDLVTLPVPQPIRRLPPFDRPLTLVSFQPDGNVGSGSLPDKLASLPALPVNPPPVSQGLVMQMYRDMEAKKILMETGFMAMVKSGSVDPAVVKKIEKAIVDGPELPLKVQLTANGINGRPFSFVESGFKAPIDTDLVWAISEETDKMLHPVHIHGCQFRVLNLDSKAPPAYMAGWKDTVPIDNAGTAEILVRFPLPAPAEAPYVAHCHILEHEDSGMMTEFTVG